MARRFSSFAEQTFPNRRFPAGDVSPYAVAYRCVVAHDRHHRELSHRVAPEAATVPEPSTSLLIALASVLGWLRAAGRRGSVAA